MEQKDEERFGRTKELEGMFGLPGDSTSMPSSRNPSVAVALQDQRSDPSRVALKDRFQAMAEVSMPLEELLRSKENGDVANLGADVSSPTSVDESGETTEMDDVRRREIFTHADSSKANHPSTRSFDNTRRDAPEVVEMSRPADSDKLEDSLSEHKSESYGQRDNTQMEMVPIQKNEEKYGSGIELMQKNIVTDSAKSVVGEVELKNDNGVAKTFQSLVETIENTEEKKDNTSNKFLIEIESSKETKHDIDAQENDESKQSSVVQGTGKETEEFREVDMKSEYKETEEKEKTNPLNESQGVKLVQDPRLQKEIQVQEIELQEVEKRTDTEALKSTPRSSKSSSFTKAFSVLKGFRKSLKSSKRQSATTPELSRTSGTDQSKDVMKSLDPEKKMGTVLSRLNLVQERDQLSATLWKGFWQTLLASEPFQFKFRNIWEKRGTDRGIGHLKSSLGEVLAPVLTNCYENPLGRLQECQEIGSSIGDQVYTQTIQLLQFDDGLKDIIARLSDVEGNDVFWDGEVDDESTLQISKPLSEYQMPIARVSCIPRKSNSSKSKFGKLAISPFPFTAEFQYDDVDERLTLSLITMAISSPAERKSIRQMMLLMIELNSSESALGISKMQMKIQRTRLRILAKKSTPLIFDQDDKNNHVRIEGNLAIRTAAKKNPSELDIWKTGDDFYDTTRGMQIRLDNLVVQRHSKKWFGRMVKAGINVRSNSRSIREFGMDEKDWFDPKTCPKEVSDLLMDVSSPQVEQQHLMRTKLRQSRLGYDSRDTLLPYSFYSEILIKSQISLHSVASYFKENSKSDTMHLITETLFQPNVHPFLIQVRRAIQYLESSSLAELHWFRYWYDVSKTPEEKARVPSSVELDLRQQSFFYQENRFKSLDDLYAVGFSKSTSLSKFFDMLETLRNHDSYGPSQLEQIESIIAKEVSKAQSMFLRVIEGIVTSKPSPKRESDESMVQRSRFQEDPYLLEMREKKAALLKSLKNRLFDRDENHDTSHLIGLDPLPKIVRPHEAWSPKFQEFLQICFISGQFIAQSYDMPTRPRERFLWDSYGSGSFKEKTDDNTQNYSLSAVPNR